MRGCRLSIYGIMSNVGFVDCRIDGVMLGDWMLFFDPLRYSSALIDSLWQSFTPFEDVHCQSTAVGLSDDCELNERIVQIIEPSTNGSSARTDHPFGLTINHLATHSTTNKNNNKRDPGNCSVH